MRLVVTSPMSIEAGDVAVDERLLGGRHARVGLALLVVERATPTHRDVLADALWGEDLPDAWQGALRGVVSKVRAALAAAGLPAEDCLVSAHGCYQLRLPPGTTVDVEEARERLEWAEARLAAGDPAPAREAAGEAAAILARPFLPGVEGEWVERQRGELQRLRTRALECLAEAAVRCGRAAEAAEAAEAVVAREPFRETGYVLLMRAHAAGGNRGEALKHYERCRTLLAEELGVSPSPATDTVYLNLLNEERQEPAPGAEAFPLPVPPPEPRPAPLPSPLSSFVGRTRELGELRHLLAEARLVTLTGPGGCGKTRLALEAAARAGEDLPDGACFVDLSPLSDPALVPQAVSAALAVRESPGRPLVEVLVGHLEHRAMLLVVDNCEQVADASATVVEHLLLRCPKLRVVATSREVLGLAGEVVVRVPPLSLPDPAAVRTLADLAGHDAVELFLERARAVQPGLVVGDDDASALGAVCAQLDGMPLALELAAARARVLTVGQIADRLADRFRLLAGPRTAVARHRTLGAALDWSHELLSGEEQEVFRRLAVFRGGFGLDAVEAVAAGGNVVAAGVYDVLDRLVAKSLVEPDGAAGALRWRLLETVRAYAGERLARAGEEVAVRDAHLSWCLGMAEGGSWEGDATHRPGWLASLDAELDNVREALRWCTERGNVAAVLRLAGAMAVYWRVRGLFSEGRRWLTQSLDAGRDAPIALRARAQWGLGLLTFHSEGPVAAAAAVEHALALASESGDERLVARAASVSEEVQLHLDAAALVPLLEDRLAAARGGEAWRVTDILSRLGWALLFVDPDRAAPVFSECLELASAGGDRRAARAASAGLGWRAALAGRDEEAESLLTEALTCSHEIGDPVWTAQILNLLGEHARRRGDRVLARRRLESALDLGRHVAAPVPVAQSTGFLGRLAFDEGDLEEAAGLLGRALALSASAGLRHWVAWWQLGLGEVAQASGDGEAADRLFAQARVTADALARPTPTFATSDRRKGER